MSSNDDQKTPVSRRNVLMAGLAAAGGGSADTSGALGQTAEVNGAMAMQMDSHGMMMTVGTVDNAANGFDPVAMLTDWDLGVFTVENGRRVRTFELIAEDKEIEIAPGVFSPAWTYNGRVPGPALRAKEGDRIRANFINNGSHPHSVHFHGIHAARMDGVPGTPGLVGPGGEFTYEFDAKPFGCHLHANFFDYYNQGTTLTPTLKTVDIITQCQAERGILEFSFADHEPGLYMLHAHQAPRLSMKSRWQSPARR